MNVYVIGLSHISETKRKHAIELVLAEAMCNRSDVYIVENTREAIDHLESCGLRNKEIFQVKETISLEQQIFAHLGRPEMDQLKTQLEIIKLTKSTEPQIVKHEYVCNAKKKYKGYERPYKFHK